MTSRGASRLLSWTPALLGMAAIFWLSSLPGDVIPLPGFRFSDKAAHFTAYAGLGLLIGIRHDLRRRLAGRRFAAGIAPAARAEDAPPGPAGGPAGPDTPEASAPPRFDRRGAWIGILYGLSDEIHQLFVPLRQTSAGDFAADALGVAAGVWLAQRLAGAAEIPGGALGVDAGTAPVEGSGAPGRRLSRGGG